MSAAARVILGPWGVAVLAAAFLGFLIVDTACLLAAAWIVTAWGKRRDKRLGLAVGVTFKTSSESGENA